MNQILQPIEIFDVHAHLYPPFYNCDEIEEMFFEAENVLKGVVVVGEMFDDINSIMKICEKFTLAYPSIGLHPVARNGCVTLDTLQDTLDTIRKLKDKIVSIGEIGLDYSPHIIGLKNSTEEIERKTIQLHVFKEHLKLAKELDLPVNVHSRNAGHYAIQCLIENQIKKVVLHAFDGKEKYVQLGIRERFHFSIPPSFSCSKPSWVKRIPLNNILIETDSPALSHIKGQRNKLINAMESLRFISCEHELSIGTCSDQIKSNTTKLFNFIKD